MSRSRLAWLWAWALVASCQGDAGPASLVVRPEFAPSIPRVEQAESAFASAVAQGGTFALASAVDEPAVVHVEANEVSPSVLRVRMTLQGVPELGEPEAIVEVERELGSVVWQEDLPLLFRRGVAVLEAQVALARGGDRHARRLLQGDDPELALLALEWATQERRLTLREDATPWLRNPDLRVSGAAIDYFGAVGSPEHALALANAARLFDREHTGRLYAALGAVGGADAIAFLAFAARNEDDPLLAELARQALGRATAAPRPVASPPQVARGHRGAP